MCEKMFAQYPVAVLDVYLCAGLLKESANTSNILYALLSLSLLRHRGHLRLQYVFHLLFLLSIAAVSLLSSLNAICVPFVSLVSIAAASLRSSANAIYVSCLLSFQKALLLVPVICGRQTRPITAFFWDLEMAADAMFGIRTYLPKLLCPERRNLLGRSQVWY